MTTPLETYLGEVRGEEWREVVGFHDFHVSNLGNVRGKSGPKKLFNSGNYAGVYLGNRINKLVHTLVLRAFVGERPKGFHGAHLDGNGRNNALSNLMWASPKENKAHKLLHGRKLSGSKVGTSKLTEEEVLEIRRRYSIRGPGRYCSVNGPTALAKEFGVSQRNIIDVINRKWWRDLAPQPSASRIAAGLGEK